VKRTPLSRVAAIALVLGSIAGVCVRATAQDAPPPAPQTPPPGQVAAVVPSAIRFDVAHRYQLSVALVSGIGLTDDFFNHLRMFIQIDAQLTVGPSAAADKPGTTLAIAGVTVRQVKNGQRDPQGEAAIAGAMNKLNITIPAQPAGGYAMDQVGVAMAGVSDELVASVLRSVLPPLASIPQQAPAVPRAPEGQELGLRAVKIPADWNFDRFTVSRIRLQPRATQQDQAGQVLIKAMWYGSDRNNAASSIVYLDGPTLVESITRRQMSTRNQSGNAESALTVRLVQIDETVDVPAGPRNE
jgi:hypothetical protein